MSPLTLFLDMCAVAGGLVVIVATLAGLAVAGLLIVGSWRKTH